MSEPTWMKVSEVVKRTGRTRQWVYHKIEQGDFASVKTDVIRVSAVDVSRYMIDRIREREEEIAHLYDNMPEAGLEELNQQALQAATEMLETARHHMGG